MSDRNLFNRLVVESTLEFFAAGGVDLRAVAERQQAMEYAAVVGFTGEKMRGVLGLGMSPETMATLAGRHAGTGHDVVSEDWLGEAGNQLLGRIRNKLLGYGVVASMALPTVLRGIKLRLMGTDASGLWTYVFESDVGDVCVWMDIRWEQGFMLPASDDPALRGTPEGAVELF